ncbi:MAG: hypothetical protein FWD68_09495 [Alphaproteobacteria bacterium]|nr:hypothetical protein [Alphaproteobacteria bacterium]
MNLATLSDLSPFQLWMLAVGSFASFLMLAFLIKASRTIANYALTGISLAAIGVAAVLVLGTSAGGSRMASDPPDPPRPAITAALTPVPPPPAAVVATVPALPALSCLDEIAGETVLAACEKAVFRSPESVAAALSYAVVQINRLVALSGENGGAAGTTELKSLRRAVERDRYGLVAQALMVRDNCAPSECTLFLVLVDRQHIVANMERRFFDELVRRHAASWNAPAGVVAAQAPGLAGLPPSVPTGRPTNAEFPSADSTPAVSIMTASPRVEPPDPTPSGSTSRALPAPAKKPAAPAKPAHGSAHKPTHGASDKKSSTAQSRP